MICRTISVSRGSKKIKKVDEKSYWEVLEQSTGAKFGKVGNPSRIIECYEKNRSVIYLVEERNGKKKLVPDLILEEQFPQFMISYYENNIQFRR